MLAGQALLLRNDIVQGGDQLVNVDAVSHGALLDVLEVGSGTADAAHAGLHEYRRCQGSWKQPP